MATRPKTEDAAGHAALADAAWDEARGHFEAALAGEETPESWEGLGWAGYWLGDAELTLRARESAYRSFRARGDRGGAARAAAWLASDFSEFRGEDAVARGWIERARRLLEDVVPESGDHGWVALHEGSLALALDADPERAAQRAREASRLGRELGLADLEAIGLAQEGIALVGLGQVEQGMRRLDEASAIAAGEELELPISTGWAMCYLVSACAGVGDFPRASQWCETMHDFGERWNGRQLMGICRTSYGRVLAAGGDWEGAETALVSAVEDLQAVRPGMASSGLARLGELRLRQGRTEEARSLFEQAGGHPAALVGLGELACDAGDPAAGADAAERVLRRLPEGVVLDRVPALELLARARADQGDLEAAARAAGELERAADELGTPYLRARSRLAAAQVSSASGDHEEARRACEDALDCFEEASAPYDAARARLQLARALAGLGRAEAAAAQAAAAREAFSKLGASRDADRADEALEPGGPGSDEQPDLGELTRRELEVLQLVAQGLGDAEIAERLVVSPHTVHRHVANIRTKLRLPSRAAAVAYAARAGLL